MLRINKRLLWFSFYEKKMRQHDSEKVAEGAARPAVLRRAQFQLRRAQFQLRPAQFQLRPAQFQLRRPHRRRRYPTANTKKNTFHFLTRNESMNKRASYSFGTRLVETVLWLVTSWLVQPMRDMIPFPFDFFAKHDGIGNQRQRSFQVEEEATACRSTRRRRRRSPTRRRGHRRRRSPTRRRGRRHRRRGPSLRPAATEVKKNLKTKLKIRHHFHRHRIELVRWWKKILVIILGIASEYASDQEKALDQRAKGNGLVALKEICKSKRNNGLASSRDGNACWNEVPTWNAVLRRITYRY